MTTVRLIHTTPTLRCPFCFGSFVALEVHEKGAVHELEGDIDLEEGDAALQHSMPPCEAFVEKDCADFLELARKAGAQAVN